MAKPQLAPAAREDIREIQRYSRASFGAAIALGSVEGLRAVLHRLGDLPRLGSSESDLFADVRSFPYKSHRIYYRVSGSSVLIVRILHHARDARSIVAGTSH